MSYWDSRAQKIVRFAAEPYPYYPAWDRIDCGCCNGLKWGGETPTECKDCGGNGWLARHRETGTLALWPGGPLRGRKVA